MIATFTVLGEPKGKGRPRFVRYGNYVRTYTPEQTASYENLIKLEYERQCGGARFTDDTPLEATILAYYQIPKSASKKKRLEMMEHKIRPIKKVDVDNLAKVVFDSLNNIAYKDDIQIVDCIIRKYYSDTPRIEVTIRESE